MRINNPVETMKTKLFIVLSLAVLLSSVVIARAQSYAIDWFTIDGGGGAMR